MTPESTVVDEIMKSIRWATKLLGKPPGLCEVGPMEWNLLQAYRPEYAEPDWRITICGVPVVPYPTRLT